MPQQRSRVLPGRPLGEIPIYQKFPRYGTDWRDALQDRAPIHQGAPSERLEVASTWVNEEPPALALKLWRGLFAVGGFEILRVLLTIVGAMLRN